MLTSPARYVLFYFSGKYMQTLSVKYFSYTDVFGVTFVSVIVHNVVLNYVAFDIFFVFESLS